MTKVECLRTHGVPCRSGGRGHGGGVDHHLGLLVHLGVVHLPRLVSALIGGGGGGRWVATHGITEAQVSPH